MTFAWTLAGTIAQLMLAGFLLMLVIFSAGGIVNRATLGKLQMGILHLSMIALPALCLLSAGRVVYLHAHGGGASSYWWYAVPVAASLLYLLYAITLSRRACAAERKATAPVRGTRPMGTADPRIPPGSGFG